MANTQTKATQKYQEKAGYISKSYKLKKDLVVSFADACEKKGISQAKAISEFMQEFIKQ